MNLEDTVAAHYAHGSLGQAILEALAVAGKDTHRLLSSDLAPIDEFHVGGRPATVAFARELGVHGGMRLLDVGCGVGGAARYFAEEHGCLVTGLDLSGEYVAVASRLAELVGLGDRVSFRQGSALALPFSEASFDAAYLLHVGMNIEDKARLFEEIRRILLPSGVLGIYDIMRLAAGDLSYPVPWASGPEASFVADAATYRQLLEDAGFEISRQRNRRDFALEILEKMRARGASAPPAPLGLHIVMGEDAALKVANMSNDIRRGLIAPIELICRAA